MLALAVLLIGITDSRLNLAQNIVNAIAKDNAPVMLPARDLLKERVTAKQEWQALNKQLDEARAALTSATTSPAMTNAAATPDANSGSVLSYRSNPKANVKLDPPQTYLAAAYETQDFIIKHMGSRDYRRAQLLSDVLTRLPDHPESITAYTDAISPEMAPFMRARYTECFTRVAAIAARMDRLSKLPTLSSLAQSFGSVNETALQRKALETIRAQYPLRFATFQSMQSLLAIMPENDPALAMLDKELKAYEVKRDQLIERARWYASFDAARRKSNPQELDLRLAGTLDASDPFTAGAIAVTADSHARAGNINRANALRKLLIDTELNSFEETSAVIEYQSRVSNEQRQNIAVPPDVYFVAYQRWRGRIDAGILDASPLLPGQIAINMEFPSWWENAVASELAIATRSFDKLNPLAQFLPDPGPSTQPQANDDSTILSNNTAIDLRPVGSAVAADVRCNLRLSLTDQTLTVVVLADEPRTSPLPAKASKRDEDLSKEDSIELFFMPDRDPNWYLCLSATPSGTVADIRYSGTPGQRYSPDKTLDLQAKVQKLPSPSGTWSMSVTLPRELVMPAGQNIIRFNARRNRVVPSGKSTVVQQYSWAPLRDGQHRPELFGYLVLPKPRD